MEKSNCTSNRCVFACCYRYDCYKIQKEQAEAVRDAESSTWTLWCFMKMVVFVTDVLSAPLLLLNKKAHKCAVSLRNRLDDFMHLVEDEQGEEEINNATFECILQIVSAHFQISEHDLLSRKRVANIVCARQVAMFLTKNLLDISIPEIGMRFGGRDHTTVIHSINRIQDEMNNDPEFKDSVYLVRDKITTNGAKHSLEN